MAIGNDRPLGRNSASHRRAAKAKALLCAVVLSVGVSFGWTPSVPDTILLPDSLGPLRPAEGSLRSTDSAAVCREPNNCKPPARRVGRRSGFAPKPGGREVRQVGLSQRALVNANRLSLKGIPPPLTVDAATEVCDDKEPRYKRDTYLRPAPVLMLGCGRWHERCTWRAARKASVAGLRS